MAVQTMPTQETIIINKGYWRTKRVLDLLFTLLILLPLCLVIAIIAILIRLDSKGPIFFRQKRVGMNGVEFDMFKLRSMYENSDDTLHRQAIEQYMANQLLNSNTTADIKYKQINDPRITRVGQFIRKTSLDELPQFFNVLRGEMTLVGPRPPLPYEVELYSPHDRLRLYGKPGLTGWAQSGPLWQDGRNGYCLSSATIFLARPQTHFPHGSRHDPGARRCLKNEHLFLLPIGG